MPISILTHKTIRFFKAILYSCLTLSLIGNSILILLVLHSQSTVMGRYRWLLIIFGLTDIVTSLVHTFTVPVTVGAPYGFALFSHTALYWPEQAGFVTNIIIVLLFMEAFVLLSFHFIYRYLALWRPTLLHVHSGKCAMFFATMNFLYSAITAKSFSDIWFYSKSETFFVDKMLSEYGVNILATPRPGFFSINFKNSPDHNSSWNWPVICAILKVAIPSALSVSICFVCTYLIHRGFTTRTLKVRFRPLQLQLFHALLLQFAVPMVFVCLPFSLCMTLPLFGFDIGQLLNLGALAFEFYPALDPFVIIFAVPRFKQILQDRFHSVSKEKFRHNELREQTKLRHYFTLVVGRDTSSVVDIRTLRLQAK